MRSRWQPTTTAGPISSVPLQQCQVSAVPAPSGHQSPLGAKWLPQPGQTPGPGVCIWDLRDLLWWRNQVPLPPGAAPGGHPSTLSPLSPEAHYVYLAQDTQL